MPKLKTHEGAAKRFKKTGSGKHPSVVRRTSKRNSRAGAAYSGFLDSSDARRHNPAARCIIAGLKPFLWTRQNPKPRGRYRVIAPKGAQVTGVVSESDPGGRVKGRARLAVRPTRLELADGRSMELTTSSVARMARATKKQDRDEDRYRLGRGRGCRRDCRRGRGSGDRSGFRSRRGHRVGARHAGRSGRCFHQRAC